MRRMRDLVKRARQLVLPDRQPALTWSLYLSDHGANRRGKRRHVKVRVPFNPDALQLEVIRDPHPRKLAIWGRQRGKTMTALLWLHERAWEYPGSVHWYVGPTYKQVSRIAWERGIKRLIPLEAWQRSPNESRLEATLLNGSKICLVGADDPDSLRGPSLVSVVLDEFATMKHTAWTLTLQPMLAATAGHALFIGTPNALRGPHMERLHRLVSSGQLAGWQYWHSPSSEAAHIDPQILEDARGTMREWEFRQEYGAEFLEISGRVWPEFRDHNALQGGSVLFAEDSGVQGAMKAPASWQVYAGIDFGWTHPTAVVWVAVGPSGQCQVVAEYSSSHGRVDEHAKHIKAISALYGGVHNIVFVGDPSRPDTMEEYAKEGIAISSANNAVDAGVDRVGRMLAHGFLNIGACCVKLRERMLHYVYDPKATRPRILKDADDECDALRYAVMAASPPENISGGEEDDLELGSWEDDPVLAQNWDDVDGLDWSE